MIEICKVAAIESDHLIPVHLPDSGDSYTNGTGFLAAAAHKTVEGAAQVLAHLSYPLQIIGGNHVPAVHDMPA